MRPAGRLRAVAGLLVVLVVWALDPARGIAEEPFAGFETDPLQPADTSSPRDTLRSFDQNITAAMQAWRQGQTLQQIVGPGRRALDTIDFSKLPEQGRFAKEVETALLLKEILDRIKLPPEEEIPDDTALDDKQNPVSRWSIPQTRITIARLDAGARAGEFLFTAETVTRLAEYYEAIRRLPYKPGALVGIYDEYTHGAGLILPRSWAAKMPAWSKQIVLGQAPWQWLGLAVHRGHRRCPGRQPGSQRQRQRRSRPARRRSRRQPEDAVRKAGMGREVESPGVAAAGSRRVSFESRRSGGRPG